MLEWDTGRLYPRSRVCVGLLSRLQEPSSVEKLFEVDSHVGTGMGSGFERA